VTLLDKCPSLGGNSAKVIVIVDVDRIVFTEQGGWYVGFDPSWVRLIVHREWGGVCGFGMCLWGSIHLGSIERDPPTHHLPTYICMQATSGINGAETHHQRSVCV
jgi:hypothetical protein